MEQPPAANANTKKQNKSPTANFELCECEFINN